MIRALIAIALALLLPVAASAQACRALSRVVIFGDSYNNANEKRTPLAEHLGLPESAIWSMGEGGAGIIRLASDGDAQLCNAAGGYVANYCRWLAHTTAHIDGACRSFAEVNQGDVVFPYDNTVCTGSSPPDPDCCTGAGTGICVPQCFEDAPFSTMDLDSTVIVVQNGINDIRGQSRTYCEGSFFTEHKAGWVTLMDNLIAAGVTRGVYATSVIPTEDVGVGYEHIDDAIDCYSNWIRDELLPRYPGWRFADVRQAFLEHRFRFGDEAHGPLYSDCPAPFPCDVGLDGVHPGNNEAIGNRTGRELEADVIADVILEVARSTCALNTYP